MVGELCHDLMFNIFPNHQPRRLYHVNIFVFKFLYLISFWCRMNQKLAFYLESYIHIFIYLFVLFIYFYCLSKEQEKHTCGILYSV